MGDSDDINKIFQIVDSDGSGYLNKEKLQLVCPHLSSSEIDMIFNDLDTDHDNRISLNEFTHGFKELIKPKDHQQSLNKKKLVNQENTIDKDEDDLTTNMTQIQINEVFNNMSWYETKDNHF
jgi:Ca2+-binding EF-hand superfamily protein